MYTKKGHPQLPTDVCAKIMTDWQWPMEEYVAAKHNALK
jgi:hypothetical protein